MPINWPDEYSDYIEGYPTADQKKALRARRRRALDEPLEEDLELAWDGPNLFPDALPPPRYPHNSTPHPSPNPPRPLCSTLLDPRSPSQGGQGWNLRLIESLQEGEDEWSQVWRCAVLSPAAGELPAITVVLKLRQESLFPPPSHQPSNPDVDSWNWTPAKHLVERESEVYSRARSLQGRDLPLCYGFYTFTLPDGEQAIGLILEDLSDNAEPLSDSLEDAAAEDKLTVENTLSILSAAYSIQSRLHDCNILAVGILLHNILMLDNPFASQPRVVFLGSGGTSQTLELVLRVREVGNAHSKEIGTWKASYADWSWRESDQFFLLGAFEVWLMQLEVDFPSWSTEHAKLRQELPFLEV
ncbi:hypothetical protein JCM10207_001901 [Rhodosporidiobolus poonsookiae]